MSQDQLRDTLDALRAETARLGAGDAEARARVEALLAELETELENPDTAALADGFGDTVQTLVTRYEVEHPNLTAVLGRVLRALESMGI